MWTDAQKKYYYSSKGIEARKKYQQSEKGKMAAKRYYEKRKALKKAGREVKPVEVKETVNNKKETKKQSKKV